MTTCVNPSCCADRASHGDEGHECAPREVRDQAYLCGACCRRLGWLLSGRVESVQYPTEIPGLLVLYEDLGESLTSARRKISAPGQSKGLSLEPIVVKAREHVVAWLFGWVRVVAEDRGLTLPTTESVETLTHWLGRHVEWLAHQPFADEVLSNLEETHREATRARQIVPPRRFELKLPDGALVSCPQPAEGPTPPDGAKVLCQGTVWATMRDDSPLLPSEIACSGDPAHRWEPHQWMAFGRHVRRDLDPESMLELTRVLSA